MKSRSALPRVLSVALVAALWLLLAAAPAARAQVPEPANEGERILQLYDQAVVHTRRVAEDYRRIRAVQLATLRDLPIEEALANIQSVMPELRPLDRILLGKGIRHPDEVEPHKREVETVKKEVEMMIELCKRLLLEIEIMEAAQMQADSPPPPELEDVLAKEQFDPDAIPPQAAAELAEERTARELQEQQLEEAAREDEVEVAKDLTPLMRPLLPDVQDLTQETADGKPLQKFNLFESSNDMGRFGDLRHDADNAALVRKIHAGGEPRKWVFLDTWHTIGPFPNPQRLNLNRQFPPEVVVDLDATYPGKDGREVAWKWVQSRDARVVPADAEEYGIWYAYTELFLDRPMDLWIALGSDDKLDAWINNLPVWVSGERLKGWKINEGYRKVSLNPGNNKILVRLENGWHSTAFSMVILAAP